MYDIIGDIHGHAEELKLLLAQLGYERQGKGFRHRERKVVFVGDFIDRGPDIAEAIAVVRSTLDAGDGFAVMGNHEYNAIAFHTRKSATGADYYRPHHAKNMHQHQATLDQLTSQQIRDALDWFKTLPIALQLDGIRVVHAAWQPNDIDLIERQRKTLGDFSPAFFDESESKGSALNQAIEKVLKGPEIQLPDGVCYTDKGGQVRTASRVKWYENPSGRTYQDYCLSASDEFPATEIDQDLKWFTHYSDSEYPVFFGHYWLSGDPQPLAANVACVDYSVAKGGKLCAYRWNGEQVLLKENFSWVDSV
jgi:hypothetical protein